MLGAFISEVLRDTLYALPTAVAPEVQVDGVVRHRDACEEGAVEEEAVFVE